MTDNDSRHADYLMTFQEEDEKHFRFLITIPPEISILICF